MTLAFILGSQLYENSKLFLCAHFLANFSVSLDETKYVAFIGWFVEAHAKFIRGRELYVCDFYKIYL